MTDAEKLAQFLLNLTNITAISTGEVSISGVTYVAARYSDHREKPQPHDTEFIFCIGMLPKVMLHGKAAFRLNNADERDWYIASYYGDIVARQQKVMKANDMHPFGNTFMLTAWDPPNSTIDQHERVKYKRIVARLSDDWVVRK